VQELTTCGATALSFGGSTLLLGAVGAGQVLQNNGNGDIVGLTLPAPIVESGVAGVAPTVFNVPNFGPPFIGFVRIVGQDVSSQPWYFNSGAFSTVTGLFTAPIAGKYRIGCQVTFDNTVANDGDRQLLVVLNLATPLFQTTEQANANRNITCTLKVAGVAVLNVGDRLEFRLSQTSTTPALALYTLPEFNAFAINKL